jgi:site-specific recombinase XerD
MYSEYCARKEKNIKAHLENPKLAKQMRKELSDFIDEYSGARKLRIPTKESYARSLSFFGEFLTDKRYSTYKQAKVEDIKEYLKNPYPRNHKEKSDSILIWLRSSLKVFYRWLLLGKTNKPRREDRYPELVDWIEVGMMRGKEITDKDILSPEEFRRILDATTNIRDRALLSMLYESGLRLGEIMEIKLEDIHFEKETFIDITRSKTTERRIYIFDCVCDLKEWLNVHPYKDNPKEFLFGRIRDDRRKVGGFKKKTISYQSVLNMVKRVGARAGIKKKVWVHLFRHTSATRDSRRGMPDDLMRLKYGWGRSSQMLNRYRHRNYEDVKNWEKERRGADGEKQIDPHEPKKCYRCGEMNDWSRTFCEKCLMSLDRETFERSLVFEKLASETTEQEIEKLKKGNEERDRKMEELTKKLERLEKV